MRPNDRLEPWAKDETTVEVFSNARERLIQAIETAPMGTADDRDHVLEMVRQLKAVRTLQNTIAAASSRKKLHDHQERQTD